MKKIYLSLILGATAFFANAQCPANQTVSSGTSSICISGSSTINLAGSEVSSRYYLRDNTNDTIIAGPISGTGSAISLNTGNISTSHTYNVIGVKDGGTALSFDGVNDYISTADNATLDPGTGSFTIELWLKSNYGGTIPSSTKMVVAKYGLAGGVAESAVYQMYFVGTGQTLICDLIDNAGALQTIGSTSSLLDDQWHHIALVRDVANTLYSLYIDGVLESSAPLTVLGDISSDDALELATRANTKFYAGAIDEFRYWNVAKTKTNIQANMFTSLLGTEANLQAYYDMENGGITLTLTDGTANVNNGTLTNMNVAISWVTGAICSTKMTNTPTITIDATPTTTTSSSNITCNGGSNGSATINSNTAYTYLWQNGSTTNLASGLSVGTTTVTVTSGACSQTATVTITEPSAVAANITGTEITCNGNADGVVFALGTGGPSSSYSYLWNNGGTTSSLSGLNAATYTVTVTSGTCSQTGSTTITNPSILTTTATATDITCNGNSDGTASVSASGGPSTAYTYLWQNGSTTNLASGLSVGTTTVTITSGACSQTATVTITEPSAVAANITGTEITCNGNADGVVFALGTGGPSSSYSYLWNNGGTTSSLSGLNAATYTVTVTSGACSQTSSVIISEPTPLAVTLTSGNVTCGGNGLDGTASVIATGGPSSSYGYIWSNATTNLSITGLGNGIYSVTISSGVCAIINSTTITTPSPYAATVSASICDGDTYFTGGANQTIAGTYVDTYTMVNGCDSVITTNLTVNVLPTATVTASIDSVCQGTSVNLTATGPNGATYLWDNAATLNNSTSATPVATPTSGTTVFTVTVTKNSCSAMASVTVTAITAPTLTVTESINTINCVDTITVASATATSFFWTTPSGNQTTTSSQSVVLITSNTQTYTVIGIDNFGCNSTMSTVTINANSSCLALSVEEVSSSVFALYPNPNNGTFSIEFGQEGNNQVKVIDVTGKLVYQKLIQTKLASVNLNITSGIYFVEVTNNNNTTIEKIVIQ